MAWIQQAGLQELVADGVTAEGRVVMPKAVLDIITNNHLATIAVNAGGTGYVVGEEFDIVGGTAVSLNGVSFIARGRVTAESAGVVTGVELMSAGAYTVDPGLTGLTTTNATLAGNDDLTLDVTIQNAYWTQDASTYVDLLTEFEWIATSTKVSNPPTIGMQSQLNGSNDGIRLMVGTSYDNLSTWLTQPGASNDNVFFAAVPNQDPNIYISTTERRVNVLITDGTFKQYVGLGLFIPFTDVDSNYPFPGFVHGQATTVRALNEQWSTVNAGVINPGTFTTSPYQYRDNLSTQWFGIENDNAFAANPRAVMWPRQGNDGEGFDFNHAPAPSGSSAGEANPFVTNPAFPTLDFEESERDGWLEGDNSQGPAPLGSTGQLHFTIQPLIIAAQTANTQMIGAVDGYEHVHMRGLNSFDEIRTEGGRRFLVFNDTNNTDLGYGVAMEKL